MNARPHGGLGLAMLALMLAGVQDGATPSGAGTPEHAGTPGHAAGATDAPMPAFVRPTLSAIPLPPSPSSTPDLQPVGRVVPKSDIRATAADSRRVLFGVAVYRSLMSATYPAISTDGGATWRIAGPRFYVAAAQAPSGTSRVGSLGSRGAYFWGPGANFVKVTVDGGRHWWVTGFAAGVSSVAVTHRTLRTVALGNEVGHGVFQAFLYVSTNSGRTWRLLGELPNVTP